MYANGGKEGAGTHMFVYVSLMRGEHDDKLTFHGAITIQLVNQNRDQDHVEYTAAFDDRAADIENTSNRVTEGENIRVDGLQKSLFPTPIHQSKQCLIKNDCIKLRVTVVRVR